MKKNKERLREQARNKYTALSNEKRHKGRNRYQNMSEENKQRLKDYKKNYRKTKN